MKIRPLATWPERAYSRRRKPPAKRECSHRQFGKFNDGAANRIVGFDPWLARRLAAGYSAQALVAAAGGAMSLRTAYRWRRDFDRIETVTVGEHKAEYVIRRDGLPPARVSPWTPV